MSNKHNADRREWHELRDGLGESDSVTFWCCRLHTGEYRIDLTSASRALGHGRNYVSERHTMPAKLEELKNAGYTGEFIETLSPGATKQKTISLNDFRALCKVEKGDRGKVLVAMDDERSWEDRAAMLFGEVVESVSIVERTEPVHAKKALWQPGHDPNITIECYRLPDGELRIGIYSVATFLGYKDPSSYDPERMRENQGKKLEALLEYGFTGQIAEVTSDRDKQISGKSCPSKTVSLDDFECILKFEVSTTRVNGKPKYKGYFVASALLGAGTKYGFRTAILEAFAQQDKSAPVEDTIAQSAPNLSITPEVDAKSVAAMTSMMSATAQSIAEYVASSQVFAVLNQIDKRQEPTEATKDLIRQVIHKQFYGKCPASGIQILDDDGQIIRDEKCRVIAHYDHWDGRHLNKPHQMWLIHRDCNQKFASGDYGRSGYWAAKFQTYLDNLKLFQDNKEEIEGKQLEFWSAA